ncbi:(2Fe-2S) ferredoxin domain-containing protein [Methylobacterium trifolii]|uniref:(2Fe-2S) ferredoxin domain-containing protein n=1 Tax=Methylobacterium trifolii TaxID=1003092 RepID=A0ABQ4TVG9_9HYPH|nr:(2Fe-2S) ferredoxin domain-containing protein [Methylobacterium trifolii]GJE57952.1 hypothetical protein MPOCJGCO_0028 [Methylobacterium trifolii]
MKPRQEPNAEAGRSQLPPVRTAKAKFAGIVAVCTKCAKRQGLPKRAVRDSLKAELQRGRSGRRLRIVETGCLGPCPKRALAVATGASLAQGRILLLDPAASPAALLAAVLPDLRPNAPLAAGSDARPAS